MLVFVFVPLLSSMQIETIWCHINCIS